VTSVTYMISGRTAVGSQSDRSRILVVTTVLLASRSCSVRSSAIDRATRVLPGRRMAISAQPVAAPTHPRRPPGRVTGSRPRTHAVRPNTGAAATRTRSRLVKET